MANERGSLAELAVCAVVTDKRMKIILLGVAGDTKNSDIGDHIIVLLAVDVVCVEESPKVGR